VDNPEAWLDSLPELEVLRWEQFHREEPFGPDGLNRMLARLCYVVNASSMGPADLTEEDYLPGKRPAKRE
jgi:hypothetical protein